MVLTRIIMVYGYDTTHTCATTTTYHLHHHHHHHYHHHHHHHHDKENWHCPDCEAKRHICLVCMEVDDDGNEVGD